MRELIDEVPAEHDVTDLEAAMHIANTHPERLPSGLLYQVQRPTLDGYMTELVERVEGSSDYDLNRIIALARP